MHGTWKRRWDKPVVMSGLTAQSDWGNFEVLQARFQKRHRRFNLNGRIIRYHRYRLYRKHNSILPTHLLQYTYTTVQTYAVTHVQTLMWTVWGLEFRTNRGRDFVSVEVRVWTQTWNHSPGSVTHYHPPHYSPWLSAHHFWMRGEGGHLAHPIAPSSNPLSPHSQSTSTNTSQLFLLSLMYMQWYCQSLISGCQSSHYSYTTHTHCRYFIHTQNNSELLFNIHHISPYKYSSIL